MAAVFDNSASTSSAANVSSLTTASWTISGSNRYLFAGVASGAAVPQDPTACKWGGSGGTGLTQNGTPITDSSTHRLSIWELIAPSTGSQTLFASWGSNQDETALGGVSYTGVDQSTPSRARSTNTLSGQSSPFTATVTVTTSQNGDLIVDAMWAADNTAATNPTIAVDASQTSRIEIEGATIGFEAYGMSEEAATGANTVMSWTVSGVTAGQGSFVSIGLPLIAAPPPGPTIDTQPADIIVYVSDMAAFSVSATASAGSLTYQWQVSTDFCATFSNVSAGTGGTTANYTTAATVYADDQTFYRCAVTDSNGTTNTRAASLRIIGRASLAWMGA